MTVQRVRVTLTLVWLACTGPAILIVVAQTVNGKFGYDLAALFMGLGWLVPLWTPITTMMLVPLTAKIDKSKPVETFEGTGILAVTYFAMILYFACIYMVIVLDFDVRGADGKNIPLVNLGLRPAAGAAHWPVDQTVS